MLTLRASRIYRVLERTGTSNSGRREGPPALHSGPMKVDAVWYFGGSTTIQSTRVVRPKIQPRHWKTQPLYTSHRATGPFHQVTAVVMLPVTGVVYIGAGTSKCPNPAGYHGNIHAREQTLV